ncbi:hypothetical protein QBC38DRAFT_280963 [Podospora fimiseda]|uniref:F-box domain-containing protein n=1 Tax=Podospora fimiseda TaxID=252190 RepID=A0AAN7BKG9_9PEZI|nr:hypothetical protein QBC38DRAFT_280963 [Podospora fimiseda]
MPSLKSLPYELVSFVIQDLDILDIRNLSRSCRKFLYLTWEGRIAKQILETKAPYSLEARHARNARNALPGEQQYAVQLRRLIKRQEAITAISPLSVAIVAHAQSWIYENGVLCYIRDLQLRLLDIHKSGSSEIVVDLCALIYQNIPASRGAHKSKIRIKPLYYADGIVSCVFSLSKICWLLVFDSRTGRCITTRPLESTAKIFVRNNASFLYYGTNSEISDEDDDEDYRYWRIWAFDLGAATWLDDKLDVPELMGADHGTTICFKIFDGYFYAVSNQAALEVEEVDWISHYTCFRFPVQRDGFSFCKPPRYPIWRRNQVEGVIDDRWYFIRMFKDEATGQLKVVESRKEWLVGRISPRRTYYTTVIDFDNPSHVERSLSENTRISTSTSGVEKMHPAVPMKPKARNPHFVHPGDDNSESFMPTLGKCPMRSYHPSCQTFIDIVDDPAPRDPNGQRIRLRGRMRRLRTPEEYAQRKRLLRTDESGLEDSLDQEIKDLYKEGPEMFWPPAPDSINSDPALASLYAILNPKGYHGNITGTWDERSLIYATGGDGRRGGLQALVLVSWDPSIHLAGTAPYPSDPRTLGLDQHRIGAPTLLYDGKGKEKEVAGQRPSSTSNIPPPDGSPDSGLLLKPGDDDWAAVEPARYLEICQGFHFLL